jgi:hypothetical protein
MARLPSAGRAVVRLLAGLAVIGSMTDPSAAADGLLPQKSASVLDRSRPEYAPIGIDLGATRLNPRLTAGVSYDDNVYATQTGEVEDLVSSLAGSLSLSRSGGIVPMSLHAGATALRYADNPGEDHVDWESGLSGSYGAGRRTSLNFAADIVSSHESRGDPSFPQTAASPPRSTVAGGTLDLQHRFASGEMTLRTDFRSRDFRDVLLLQGDVLDQDFRDRNSLLVEAQSTFAVRRSIGALLRFVRKQEDYRYETPGGLNRNSASNALYGGTAFEITNLMRGQIGVGVLQLENRDARQADRTSVAVSANVEFYATQLMTLTVNVQRTAGPADIAGSASYIGTNASLRVDYELRRNLILSTAASTFRREYTGVAISESTHRATAGARWLLNRRLSVSAQYAWERGRWPPENGDRTFTRNLASVALGMAL